MTLADDTLPFPSSDALRAAQIALLRRYRAEGLAPALLADAETFLRRTQATGALLDSDVERGAAQGLLDYWVAVLERGGRQVEASTLADFDPRLTPELSDTLCPYLGLDPFSEQNAGLFFGRRRMVDELVTRLASERVLAVVGPSGSGKSSLVRAGLLTALRAGALAGSASWEYLPPIVPGARPINALGRLIALPDFGVAERDVAAELRQDPTRIGARLQQLTSAPVILVVDQFEEIFTLCWDDDERQAFINALLALAGTPESPHRVVLTMRSDFEPYVARYEALFRLFEASRTGVPPLSVSELRNAIEEPARQIGLRFEGGVVDALLQDVLGEPAALPLLQFTLLRLWESRERNRVTWKTYQRVGGGRLALARSADALYNSLIPEEQVTARRLLLRMVRPGEGLEVTSNRVRRADIYRGGEDPGRIDRVLTRLVEARLLRLTSGDTRDDDQVEVAHEALVRNWPTLVDWLEDDRVVLRQRQRLSASAEAWERLGRDPGALLRGALLVEAEHFSDLSELERQFILASRQVSEAEAQTFRVEEGARATAERGRVEELLRVNRRLRMLNITLVIVLALSLLILLVALAR